jgi:hypothetical protein
MNSGSIFNNESVSALNMIPIATLTLVSRTLQKPIRSSCPKLVSGNILILKLEDGDA